MSTNGKIVVADHAPLLYTPNFWDPRKAYMDYDPDIEGAYREGVSYCLEHGLESAFVMMKRGISHAIMLTDLQGGFRDQGELPVVGTNDVVLRVCVRIINGIVTPYYTIIVYSLDGHPLQHISFDYYWRNLQGDPLNLALHNKAACLTLEDDKKAVFRAYGFDGNGGTYNIDYVRAKFDTLDSVAYWNHLQNTGQGDIWTFVGHCIIGTPGANLHPFLMETLAFAAGVRSIQPTILNKGHISTTDWFGPLEPCRPDPNHPQGGFQKQIIDDAFKPVATVDFAGVAEDFCDYFMKRQTLNSLDGTSHIGKLRFLKDGTAPIIPNAQHVIALNAQAQADGVVFINHDAPLA